MYKIIACDLDETLLKLNRTIDDRDKAAIAAAKEKGVKFVPATGRGFLSVSPTLAELGLLDEEGQYVISYNGGAITENKGNRLLYFQGISFEKAKTLYERGIACDVCVHVYTKDSVYCYNLFENEKQYLNNRMEVTEIFSRDIEFLRGQEIVKVLYASTDMPYLNKIERELSDLTYDLDVSYSSHRYLEFNYAGVNKGEGLKKLADLLGVDIKDTVAIGDNINDLPMIRAAGLGVGVQNAVDRVKEDCDYICRATCDEAAVSEVIEKFILS